MHVEMITREDLHQFKTELLTELKTILTAAKPGPQGKWLSTIHCGHSTGFKGGAWERRRAVGGTSPCEKHPFR